MFGKAHQSMWSILSLLMSHAILLRAWSTQIYFGRIFAWFQWLELSWLCLNISRPQINVFISFKHRLVSKLQKILKLDDFSKASESFVVMKASSPNMTSQIPYICFQSRRGHFWFVFVKLSETVGFSYLGRHGLCKTWFWELILPPIGITDVFQGRIQDFKRGGGGGWQTIFIEGW